MLPLPPLLPEELSPPPLLPEPPDFPPPRRAKDIDASSVQHSKTGTLRIMTNSRFLFQEFRGRGEKEKKEEGRGIAIHDKQAFLPQYMYLQLHHPKSYLPLPPSGDGEGACSIISCVTAPPADYPRKSYSASFG